MRYRVISYLSAVIFGIGLLGYLLPWMVVASEPISGFDVASGKYNIAPTEVYALLAAIAALCGGIIPFIILRRQDLDAAVVLSGGADRHGLVPIAPVRRSGGDRTRAGGGLLSDGGGLCCGLALELGLDRRTFQTDKTHPQPQAGLEVTTC